MLRLQTAPTLAAAAVLLTALLAGCGSDSPSTGDGTAASSESTTASTSLDLTVPAAQAGRCMVPNVENLATQDTAFEGVVTAVADGSATLDVTNSFKGEDAATVVVAAPSQDLQDLLVAVEFEVGQTYLVSSLDGQVSLCGLSGPKDDQLSELYQQAYAG